MNKNSGRWMALGLALLATALFCAEAAATTTAENREANLIGCLLISAIVVFVIAAFEMKD